MKLLIILFFAYLIGDDARLFTPSRFAISHINKNNDLVKSFYQVVAINFYSFLINRLIMSTINSNQSVHCFLQDP